MTAGPEQWIHMVGIAGAGMSGIARVLCEQGIRVSGSDLQTNSITSQLESIGVQVYEGHSAANVKEGVQLLVISSAIPADNMEIKAARQLNIPIIKRGQMLARIVNQQRGLAIAGAHGKTTTTSMLYTILAGCDLDPTFIVGGEIQGTTLNAQLGKNDFIVVEADESDASFLEITPFVAIVTNIENDHLDFYESMERIQSAFLQFLNQVTPGGFAVAYGGDQNIQAIRSQLTCRCLLYGEEQDCDYYLGNWQPLGMGSRFDVFQRGSYVGQLELSIPGRHNALNALAAAATALELGQEFAAIQAALKVFPGAKRRFQIMASINGITIIDDYAHHPTEIEATIKAAREFHKGRIIVVFQPHRYTRTKLLAEQFGTSFGAADLIIVSDIYSAGEKPIPAVSGELIYQAVKRAGGNVMYIPVIEDMQTYLGDMLQEDDLLITMGAGDVWKLGLRLAQSLNA